MEHCKRKRKEYLHTWGERKVCEEINIFSVGYTVFYYLFEVILETGFTDDVNKNLKAEGIDAQVSIFRENHV